MIGPAWPIRTFRWSTYSAESDESESAWAKERSQPGYWAEYLSVWDEPIVEGFQSASCHVACKAIATCAAQAWGRGWTAEQWRTDLLSRHHEEEDLQLIAQAEQCMRTAGLRLWNNSNG